jgi:hypothetical protein
MRQALPSVTAAADTLQQRLHLRRAPEAAAAAALAAGQRARADPPGGGPVAGRPAPDQWPVARQLCSARAGRPAGPLWAGRYAPLPAAGHAGRRRSGAPAPDPAWPPTKRGGRGPRKPGIGTSPSTASTRLAGRRASPRSRARAVCWHCRLCRPPPSSSGWTPAPTRVPTASTSCSWRTAARPPPPVAREGLLAVAPALLAGADPAGAGLGRPEGPCGVAAVHGPRCPTGVCGQPGTGR